MFKDFSATLPLEDFGCIWVKIIQTKWGNCKSGDRHVQSAQCIEGVHNGFLVMNYNCFSFDLMANISG